MSKKNHVVAAYDSINNGQFFTIIFEKKNGKIRKLNGRKGVKKHLRGHDGDNKRKPSPEHIRIVFDRKIKDYRSFDEGRLLEVRCYGKVFK